MHFLRNIFWVIRIKFDVDHQSQSQMLLWLSHILFAAHASQTGIFLYKKSSHTEPWRLCVWDGLCERYILVTKPTEQQ